MQNKLTKDINEYTKEEFLEIENFGDPNAEFNAIIIVPTGELHDSGFQTMKFILTNDREIVMACSGWSDVIHINGIGGYGRYGTKEYEEAVYKQRVKRVGWSIDCLAKSGCVRLFTSDVYCKIEDALICSDFIFYVERAKL